jgi:outer membrane assembly lipoprotein YfiO
MRKTFWVVLCLALLPGSMALAAEPPAELWEIHEGRWQRVQTPTTAPVADETLDHVESMIQAKQGEPARKIAVAWLRMNKDSPLRDRGIYLLGQANFVAGNRINAFYNFDEVLDKYPGSRYFYPCLERQYDIADQFLRGYKRSFLGLPILDASTEATEMLYRIQQRAPGSPLAEKCLLRAADFYYAEADYDIAADAYAAYVRQYPRSPLVPRVRLRQAFASLAQFRGVKFDATPIIDARQQLLDLAGAYPRLAEQENIPAIIARIDSALARKIYEVAAFYMRIHKPKASAYYYQYLIKSWPESLEAATAKERLSKLPASALETPRLPPSEGAEPTTRPATQPTASPTNPESR